MASECIHSIFIYWKNWIYHWIRFIFITKETIYGKLKYNNVGDSTIILSICYGLQRAILSKGFLYFYLIFLPLNPLQTKLKISSYSCTTKKKIEPMHIDWYKNAFDFVSFYWD